MTTRADSGRTAETAALVRAVSQWIDDSPDNRVRDAEALLWGRVAKVSEEAGEVVAALIGATGQNPRKGVSATMGDVERELLDVAMTALCAVAHLHADDDTPADVMGLLQAHVVAVAERAGLT
ncbi:MazG-like family protein [Streptomyces triculaminicus]|uniref:MazG-like family protein n=1 Tax=Streptomyces triculaminicus TaxID=2816232 RepID=UPI0037BE1551